MGRRRGTRDSKKYKKVDGGVRPTLCPVFRRRIFGDGLRCMGSARVGCQMLYVDGMLRSQDLVDDEGTFPLGLKFVLFLVRQA